MADTASKPRIALVYDKVSVRHGGAERVLEALHQAFPDAPLFTSLTTPQANWAETFEVKPSFLQHLAWLPQSYRVLVPFFPFAFESLDFSDFDIVISVTSGEAKGILTKPEQLHICYLLTPPRYLYSHADEYLNHSWVRNSPARLIARRVVSYLRKWDQVAATRPDYFIPISELVAKRVHKYYGRLTETTVYPPCPLSKSVTPISTPQPFLLSVSRHVPYKRVDLSIAACLRLHMPLLIVGEGMETAKLQQLASNHSATRPIGMDVQKFIQQSLTKNTNILFLGLVSEFELQQLYASALALLMPGLEDFGITALEAAAQGTPTIMSPKSGVAEILPAPKLSIALPKLTIDAMIESVQQLESMNIISGDLQKVANNHTFSYFSERFTDTITKLWHDHCLAKELHVTP